MIGFIGDVHGNYENLSTRMKNHKGIKEWVQVGDLGGEKISYVDFPSDLAFISGNHENWDEIEKMHEENWPNRVMHIENGCVVQIEGLRILGFGGNYSSKYFEYAKKDLQQHRRRHFVREEYEDALSAGSDFDIDILITHEAPAPYKKIWGKSEREMGIELITELVKSIKPKYHFFGHHHKMSISNIGSTRSIGLGRSDQEFFTVSPETLEIAYIDNDNKINREPLITS